MSFAWSAPGLPLTPVGAALAEGIRVALSRGVFVPTRSTQVAPPVLLQPRAAQAASPQSTGQILQIPCDS